VNIREILLCEDDAQDEKLTLAALEEHNLANRVFVVRDGDEALDYLYCRGAFTARLPGNPVAIMLDLKMPKVTGLEVLRIIKADDALKGIPVVVLTSSREGPDVTECYQHGVNAYVVKPVDFNDFMNAVKLVGIFWAAVNEPPPNPGRRGASIPAGEAISTGNHEDQNEINTPNPAFRR